jgi:hypothetical protein
MSSNDVKDSCVEVENDSENFKEIPKVVKILFSFIFDLHHLKDREHELDCATDWLKGIKLGIFDPRDFFIDRERLQINIVEDKEDGV